MVKLIAFSFKIYHVKFETYEKGLELEKLVAELFRRKGYDVIHNIKLKGRSGVEHQIDVYAEYKCPLHLSRIIIECKAYDKPINKEIVMKLIQIVNDLGVDKGILITTSYFTPDAVSTAEGYNIELWDSAKLNELLGEIKIIKEEIGNIYYIEPQIALDKARKIAERKIGGFLRKGEIIRELLVFYPLFEFDADIAIHEKKGFFVKKSEVKIVNAKVTIDAVNNGLVDIHQGLRVLFNIPSELKEEEIMAFRNLLSHGELNVAALASLLSCSEAKSRKILQGLVVKGLVKQIKSGRTVAYVPAIRIPHPSQLESLSMKYKINPGKPTNGTLIPQSISVNAAEKFLKTIWDLKIKEYKLIYYPFYAFVTKEKDRTGTVIVDATTGEINEELSKTFTYSLLSS